MKKRPPRPMTPFDERITFDSLYIMKLLLPFFPDSLQRIFAIFIKYWEFRYTIRTFYGFHDSKIFSDTNILTELSPYMDPESRQKMDQMQNMMNIMQMMKQTDPNISDQSSSDADTPETSAFDFMKNMMDEDQQDLFQKYTDIFEKELNNMSFENAAESAVYRKGESENDRLDKSSGNAEP